MLGVSPAYFISRFGDRFSPDDVATGIDELAAIGYAAAQLEIYHLDSIDRWSRGGMQRTLDRAAAAGLRIPQFVGHCLLNGFIDDDALASALGIAEIAAIVAMLDPTRCPVVTVPLPTYRVGSTFAVDAAAVSARIARARVKLAEMARIATEAGFRFAVEVVPGAVIGDLLETTSILQSIEAELSLTDNGSHRWLGINLDTGHAWAQKRLLYALPATLGPRIFGTHLCDNFGHENLSLAPGRGSIDWTLFTNALRSSGYTGSWDIEIHCRPEDAIARYSEARAFMGALGCA